MKIWIRQMSAAAALALNGAVAWAGLLPGPLVDTQWLAQHLDKVQIVEVRANVKSFTQEPEIETDAKGKKTIDEIGGHIPGSRLIESKAVRVERQFGDLKVKYMIPERADFQTFVQKAGIDAGKPIVIVPIGLNTGDINDGMRMYWQFKVYGEDDIAVLDGGMAAWLLEGRSYATDAPPAKTGNWVSKADLTQRYWADSTEVAATSHRKNATLVDAREANQFHGLIKRDYVFGYGHIEGAVSLSPDTTYKTSGGAIKMLSANTYRAVLKAQGIDPDAPAIVYCNSGAQSGLPWFIMSEIIGNRQVKQYDGSLHQWTLEKRPLAGAVPLN